MVELLLLGLHLKLYSCYALKPFSLRNLLLSA
jgi:hypothetical protein